MLPGRQICFTISAGDGDGREGDDDDNDDDAAQEASSASRPSGSSRNQSH